MREQVTRHLERARIAARVAVVGTLTDVAPVVQALARTMEKTHHDKRLAIDVDVPEEARFRGERQDLEEMVGNLVDNACKWASARVAIEVLREQPAPGRNVVRVVVDDDGPGLTPSERDQVAKRGRRLDETKPGSGLGLSIVVELAGLYGGALHLGTAPIGGLRAELTLPAG
jgi:signal transduction histidine kinase